MALLSIIGPAEWAAFSRAFAGMRTHAHATADRTRFAPLWSEWEFDAVLRCVPLPQLEDFRLIRAGKPLPSGMYRERNGTVLAPAVQQLWANGVSFVLACVDTYSDRLLALGRFLEAELRCPVQLNLYGTPGESQGLGAHVDRHDVLVLQLRGEKTWHIEAPDPIPGAAAERPGGRQTVVLRSGDWLYVPKGVPHEVRNTGTEPSLHLTVGFYPLTWADVLRSGLERATLQSRPLMARIPAGAPTDDSVDALTPRLQALLPHLDVAATARDYFSLHPQLGTPVSPRTTRLQIEAADAQTRFAWRRDVISMDSGDAQVRLHRPDRRFPLALQSRLRPVVAAMSAPETFRCADLSGHDPAEALGLARLLANAGVLDLPATPP